MTTKLKLEYDREGDAFYGRFGHNAFVERTTALDRSRLVDYDSDGRVIGVESLYPSLGVIPRLMGSPPAAICNTRCPYAFSN